MCNSGNLDRAKYKIMRVLGNRSEILGRVATQVLWEELLEGVILHITPLRPLLHMLLKDIFSGKI